MSDSTAGITETRNTAPRGRRRVCDPQQRGQTEGRHESAILLYIGRRCYGHRVARQCRTHPPCTSHLSLVTGHHTWCEYLSPPCVKTTPMRENFTHGPDSLGIVMVFCWEIA